MNDALKVLQKPGKPIKYKMKMVRQKSGKQTKQTKYGVQWDSEKQRRAFFATNGFGAGIPYKRTGRYAQSFRVTKTGKGAARRAYTLENTWPKSMYVGGNAAGARQSRIHEGRWPLIKDTLSKFVKRLVTDVKSKSQPKIKQAIRAAGLRTR
jgi:hypothetical protein